MFAKEGEQVQDHREDDTVLTQLACLSPGKAQPLLRYLSQPQNRGLVVPLALPRALSRGFPYSAQLPYWAQRPPTGESGAVGVHLLLSSPLAGPRERPPCVPVSRFGVSAPWFSSTAALLIGPQVSALGQLPRGWAKGRCAACHPAVLWQDH